MAQFQMLNNVVHKDLKVITKRSIEHGDNVGGSLIFPEEFMAVQKEYPIFFQKDQETGGFQAVAIFGFNQNENLFLDSFGWNANYIPALMERDPFLIGFQLTAGSENNKEPVIHINMESSRISKTDEGEAVFLAHGGNSTYIDGISKKLMLIHEGLAISEDMFAALLSFNLIESFVLDIEFDNGEQYKSETFYTLNQEAFFALDDASLGRLHKVGYLHYASMVIASLSNIATLIAKRNAQNNAAIKRGE